MSLGHLTVTPSAYRATQSRHPNATAIDTANCLSAGKASGFNTTVIEIFRSGALSQRLPTCPRPAVCRQVRITVRSCSSPGERLSASVFVEGVSAYSRTSNPPIR